MLIAAITLLVILLLILWLRFRSLRYSIDSEKIEIKCGIFIKTARTISRSRILWHTSIKFKDRVLVTVLHTAAGREIVFADTENFKPSVKP